MRRRHGAAGWWIVFCKEVLENVRDRRALGMALLYGPLFGPLLFALTTAFVIGHQREESEKPLKLAVSHAERAPNLVGFLRAQSVMVEDAPADPEAAIRAQARDVILRIPEHFADEWRGGEPAAVELLSDASRQSARVGVERVRQLLEAYSTQIGRLRLIARGLDPELATAIVVADRDLSTAQSRGAMLLAMLPYFLILCAFLGGMYLAIDATAGERERASLEPLLVNPVPPTQIMAGKLAATAVFALASVLSCVAAFTIGLTFIPAGEFGLVLAFPPKAAAMALLLIAPVALLAASVQTIIASFARTFREAQTYLQFLMILPAIPSVALVVNPIKPVMWMLATPLLSQSLLINQLVRGDTLAAGDVLLSVAGTLVAAMIASLIAMRLYRGERLALAV